MGSEKFVVQFIDGSAFSGVGEVVLNASENLLLVHTSTGAFMRFNFNFVAFFYTVAE